MRKPYNLKVSMSRRGNSHDRAVAEDLFVLPVDAIQQTQLYEVLMKCNLCNHETFVDLDMKKNVQCEKCGSLVRTRLLWMYLQRIGINEDSRILHIAPEKGLYDVISKQVKNDNYITADFNADRYTFAPQCITIDLCQLDSQSSSNYDLIIHSHVLEHTPCNIAYTLFHLHRMLKDEGRHICIVPFMGGRFDECFQDLSDEEKQKRFGQHDHVRRFGVDDIDSHIGKLVKLPRVFDATQDFTITDLQAANIPRAQWKGFHGSTVLALKKYDMKLLQPPMKATRAKEKLSFFS